jgi:hypothetical protein
MLQVSRQAYKISDLGILLKVFKSPIQVPMENHNHHPVRAAIGKIS